jgi:acyl-CoA dehydrogenase
MDLSIPEELEMVSRTVKRFVDQELRPLEKEVEETDHIDKAVDRRLRKKAVELGLYGHNLPEAVGGGGLTTLGQALIGEELGRTTMALASTAGFLPGGVAHGKPHQRSWFVDPILRADKVVAYALTEPDAGSDMQRVATRARRENGRWILKGTKQFISNAEHADFVMVVAVTNPSAPLRTRFTMFIVERDNPGYRYIRSVRAMGWRGHSLGVFSLDDCVVEDDHVLGEVDRGFDVAMGHINATRIHLSGRYLGMANELIEMAVDYAKQRVAFGAPLAQHQALQFMLADCDVEREAARYLMYAAALAADAGDPSARIAASRSKLYGSEMVGRVADRVLQLFGGAGYVADLPIERMYRDARAFRIGEGTSEMQRIQIARHLLGR